MVKKKNLGGKRVGAGRKPNLNEEEQFVAWHRYNLLVQNKSLTRFGRDFFGEENWDGLEGLKKDIDFIRSIGAKAKSDEEKTRERTNYLLSKDYNNRHENIEACLAGRASRYLEYRSDKDEDNVWRNLKISSKANGKLRDRELTQAEMYDHVAKSLSEDPRINRKISARSVEQAIKLEQRRRRELPEEEIVARFKLLIK